MRPLPRTRSIERPITRAVYLTALASCAICLTVSAWTSDDDRLADDQRAAADAAEMLATTLTGHENFSACLEKMVDHPRTLAAAIWQAHEDRPREIASRDSAAHLLLDQPAPTVAQLRHGESSRWVTVTAPILSGRLPAATLGLVLTRPPVAPGGPSMAHLITMGSLALIPAMLAHRYLRTRFFRPLEWLTSGLADDPRRPIGRLLARRRDEIGVLTAELARRRRKTRYWRRRCRHWMLDNEARVHRETHEIRTQLQRTQREAERDALTGILNRRQLERRLDTIFDAQRMAGEDLSIVMLDIDHFKHLNDTLGHAAGDALLSFAGELIRSHVRATDLAVRYGGDEFTLVLPGVNEERAGALAARLVSLFAQRARALGVSPAPTLSFGAAGLLNRAAKSPSELLAFADRSLYESKRLRKTTARKKTAVDQSAVPTR